MMIWLCAAVFGALGVTSTAECPAVALYFARGTFERRGLGQVGVALRDELRRRRANIEVFPIDYPAKLVNPLFHISVQQGARNAAVQIRDMVKKCPDVKLVLAGYSQGAAVIHEIELDDLASSIIAIIVFGDPYRLSLPPKWPIGASRGVICKICRSGDPICLNGLNPKSHLDYELDTPEAANFIIDIIEQSKPSRKYPICDL
uniref:Predicted protein putative n=1 Tax=Albugo laibachii Nc14 TaxID=890382 RepID=F0WE19_9STRA|nr:predicted protein putative [Albugo laibachii Nc14]|eukprot:CCA19448.1 predicted protein putative [Albugo laibachii Nc14]